MGLSENEIANILVSRKINLRETMAFQNISWGFFQAQNREADLLVVSRNRYVTEIEIKTSVADFKKDAVKSHRSEQSFHRDKRIKRLYYAMPARVAEKIEYLPSYAGLYIVSGDNWHILEAVKLAINTSAKPLDDSDMMELYRLQYFRAWKHLDSSFRHRREKNLYRDAVFALNGKDWEKKYAEIKK